MILEVVVRFIWMILICFPILAQTEPEDNTSVEEVMVVTANKSERKLEDLPISASVIDRQTIAEQGVIVAGEELLAVPGVFVRRDGEGAGALSASIRGLTGVHGNDTFLALLDGIPFVSAHEEILLSELPIGATDRVEVIRGPVSALYGRGALSGAINYITRSPAAEPEFALELRGGSFGYAHPHLSATLSAGQHNLLIDGYVETSDGWRDNSERDAANILIKDEMVLSPSARLTAYVNVYQSTQGAGGQIPIDADGNVLDVAGGRTGFIGYEPNEYDRETIMTALRHQWSIDDALDLTTTVHYRNVRDNNVLNFFDPFGFDPDNNILRVNGFENDRDTDVLFVEPRITWQGERHNLTAGLNWERVTLTETDWWTGQNGFDADTFAFYFYEINIDYITGEVLNRDHPFWVDRNEAYRGDATNALTAAYVQDEWQLNAHATLTLGMRYDVFERDARIDSDVDFDGVIDENPAIRDEEEHVSPKLALHYRFADALNAYASYGEGFNSNFGAVWQWDPALYQRGTEVKPSIVRNVEVGAKGRTGGFAYSLAIYNMIQEDRLVFVSDPDGFGLPQASTADEFESTGLELETTVDLAEGWAAQLGYAYIDAVWNDYTVAGVDYADNRPTGVPENTLSLGLRGRLAEGLNVWSSVHVFDAYFFTLDNRVSGGDHELLDVGIGYLLPSLGAEISLTGKNVLDEEYDYLFGSVDPSTATPGLPARFLLSVSFDFGRR